MTAQTPEPTITATNPADQTATDPAAAPAPQTPAAAAPAEPNKAAEPPEKSNPWDDPAAAKAEIEKLRKENGAARTSAKAAAAEDARNEIAQTIGKALGLVVDDEPVDPAALTEQATRAAADAKQAKLELAVFRNAPEGADAVALLDSRTFLEKVKDIDPGDTAALAAAITEAVTQNPRLGKAINPGMKPNPAQGRSASPPLGLDEQIAAAAQAGDMRTVLRLKAAQTVKNSNP